MREVARACGLFVMFGAYCHRVISTWGVKHPRRYREGVG